MSPKRQWVRPALRGLGRISLSAGLVFLFLSGSLSAFVLYANLPAGRRIVALALQRTLADTFEGTFSIDAVEHVSLGELRISGFTVQDPDGHLVLSVSALSAQTDLLGLLRKLLFGAGALTLRFDHVALERAEVYLQPGQKNDVPSIADAFTPRPSKPGAAPSASTRTLKIWFPEIQIRHIYGRMALGNLPTIEAELAAVHGSVVGSGALTTVDVERFSALVRGLGGADARGVGSVHVRAPGGVFTSFDGYLGDVQLGSVVRVDGPALNITLDVPRAEPAAVRALWLSYPLREDASAHVEALGDLQSLHTQAQFSIGKGTLTSSGELRLGEHPGADLDISGRALDLRALWPEAPATEIDSDATLTVVHTGADWVTAVSGSTRPAQIMGAQVPAIDLSGSYDAKGFSGHALVHEPGIPLTATFQVHPDGSIDGSASASRVDLSRAPRLEPYFPGKGLLDLRLSARVDKQRLVVHADGALDGFEYGKLSIKSNKFSGRASGPWDAPGKLSIDLKVASKGLRIGALGFDELETKLSGPVTRPVVSTTITNQRGPLITARATVTARAEPRIDDLTVDVRRDQAVLSAKVARVEIRGDAVQIGGLSLEGAGGTLEASGSLGPERVAVLGHGSKLDLGLITYTLGLPRGLLSGKLALNANLDATRKAQRGSFDVKLEHGESEGVVIDSLALDGSLNGSELALHGSAQLRDFGDISAEARTLLTGSLADVRTYQRATGVLTVKAEHVPFGLLGYALPKSSGVNEVRGEGGATLVLDRSEPNAIPNLSVLANTTGLYVGLARAPGSAKGSAFEGIDAHAGLSVNGQNGETDLTLKLEDRKGVLVSATTHLTVDLPRALRHPELVLAQLRQTPLVAKAVVEDRALEDLPEPITPKGVKGRLRTELSLSGTVDSPLLSDKTELSRLRLGGSETDQAIDVCAQLDYDKRTGQYGLRSELFLPSESAHACQGRRVAQLSAGGRAEWAKLMGATSFAGPAWTGSAGLSLEGLPLDFFPTLAEAGLEGQLQGVVMFDRRQALPQIRSQLEVRGATFERTPLGTAVVQAQTDGRSLTASLKVMRTAADPSGVSVPSGILEASIQSSLNWQGVVPGLDATQPISANVNAKDVDAVILTPFVRDVLSEISGKLDANLNVTLMPAPGAKPEQPWTGAVKGSLSMHDGTVQLAQLALRMRNVKLAAFAEPHEGATLISIQSLSAAAEADKVNVFASGNLWLSGFRVESGNASVNLQGVPLLVEGVTLATLNGKEVAVGLERHPTEMFVGLTIPELEAKLPQAGARSLIALGSNESIDVAQPIAEPNQSGTGSPLPWRLKFDLGNKVKVTRSDLFLPISGSPEIVLGEQMQILGDIDLRAGGRLNLPGLPRPFTIENGTVFFDRDGDSKNPRLSVRAVCQLSQLTVWATVTGTFRDAKVSFESDDPSLTSPAQIEAALLSAPSENSSPAAAGIGAGAGYLGKQLLANTALSNLELKAGSETTADQNSYSTYSAAYQITDDIWFEGSYKTLQTQDLSGANPNAFSGSIDWRFRRNWSLNAELGNIGAGLDLLWLYRY